MHPAACQAFHSIVPFLSEDAPVLFDAEGVSRAVLAFFHRLELIAGEIPNRVLNEQAALYDGLMASPVRLEMPNHVGEAASADRTGGFV